MKRESKTDWTAMALVCGGGMFLFGLTLLMYFLP